jgi:hypothetical protein
MAQVVIRADVEPVLVEVHPYLGVYTMSVDSLQCNYDKEGSSPFDCRRPSPGVIRPEASTGYSRETENTAYCLLGALREVS